MRKKREICSREEQCRKCYFYGTSTSDHTCDRYLILGIGHRIGHHEPGQCPKFLNKRCTIKDIEENAKLDDKKIN